jgi:diguanylate cyclase (GGDEF)-like protein
MLRVVGCLTQAHDLGLVALAFAVCVLATNATTRLLCSSSAGIGEQPKIRLGAAIVAFGTGVWATHFISILAYLPGTHFSFDLPLIALSLAFAIGTGSLAFILAPLPANATGRAAGVASPDALTTIGVRGLILASGICMMHFVGMRGVQLPGTIRYQADLVIASFGLTMVCATVAMWLLARRRPGQASIFLMLAVVSTHFIAMGSITLDASGPSLGSSLENSKLILAIATSAACVLILALAVAATGLERYHDSSLAREARRFRALADATSEGLVFEHGGRVTDVNRAMCRITGSDAARLIGLKLGDIIPGFVLMPPSGESGIEYLVLLPDGQTRPIEALWRDDPDHGGHVLAIRDLSRQKAAELLIDQLARFDSLTGLGNRDMFEQQLQKALAVADRDTSGVTLLYIGLNRLDNVHEALGPRAGEQVLIQASRRLSVLVEDSDTLARVGRDEFAIIRPAKEQQADAGLLADRIVTEMSVAFSVDDLPIELSANVGFTKYPADGPTPASLIRNATLALRQAKSDGVGYWRCFESRMDLQSRSKQSLEHDLRIALAEGQFSLNYQPFIEIESQLLSGYEALLRWDHPERGRVSPSEFIPIAEECGLIGAIGNWVLATACAEAASWNDPVTISVNLSPAQFIRPILRAIG